MHDELRKPIKPMPVLATGGGDVVKDDEVANGEEVVDEEVADGDEVVDSEEMEDEMEDGLEVGGLLHRHGSHRTQRLRPGALAQHSHHPSWETGIHDGPAQ